MQSIDEINDVHMMMWGCRDRTWRIIERVLESVFLPWANKKTSFDQVTKYLVKGCEQRLFYYSEIRILHILLHHPYSHLVYPSRSVVSV